MKMYFLCQFFWVDNFPVILSDEKFFPKKKTLLSIGQSLRYAVS